MKKNAIGRLGLQRLGRLGLPRRFGTGGGSGPASLWPTASSTGARSTPSTPVTGDVNSTANGQIISGLAVTNGTIIITHQNVTVQDCSVSTTGTYCVEVRSGATGAKVQYNDLQGAQTAIQGFGLFERNDIRAVENGIVIASGSTVTVKDNYIHDLFYATDPHYDGIAAQGGCNDIEISGNWIAGSPSVTIQGIFVTSEFGAANNINIHDNYIGNCTYNVTVGTGITNAKVQNNTLQMGSTGFYNFTASGMTVSGNVSTRGLYIDGDVVPLASAAVPPIGVTAFTPSAALNANDANINTGFRVVSTLAQAGSQYRVIFKASTAAGTRLQGMAAGKQSSGVNSALALQELLFGGVPLTTTELLLTTGVEVVSDWFTPPASLIVGDAMIVGYKMGNPGGTRLASGNTNVTSYFGSTAAYADAAPAGYTQSANSDFGIVRIEAKS